MKMKKKLLKKLILVLILTLSLFIIPLFTASQVKADGASLVEINGRDAYYTLGLNNIDFDKEYYDIEFLNNYYGGVGLIETEDAIFWTEVMKAWRDNHPSILVGCELVISLRVGGIIYPYTIGFTYNTDQGMINQYTGNDAAVTLGTQLCNARTGLKTYLNLKDIDFWLFEIAAIEMYMRTEDLEAATSNPIEYYYRNPTTNTFNDDSNYLLDVISNGKLCEALVYNYSFQDAYEKGLDIGYDNGYNAGITEGYTEGYKNGSDIGYANGYDIGYDIGFEEGKDNSGFGIVKLMSSVLASFFGAFWTFASFEIFGIQLWVIPAIIGGVGLIWVVIKFFLGKGE